MGTKVGLAKDQPFYSIFSHPSHSECDIMQYIMIVIFTLSELLPPNRIVAIVLTISVIVCAECDDKRLKTPRGDCWAPMVDSVCSSQLGCIPTLLTPKGPRRVIPRSPAVYLGTGGQPYPSSNVFDLKTIFLKFFFAKKNVLF